MDVDVLIIGAGLSGLHSAWTLQQQGVDALLVEARERPGGRILSVAHPDDESGAAGFDLGPAWFWPGQLRMQALIDALGITDQIFEQASDGLSLFEDPTGRIVRGVQGVSMRGSLRLRGGMQQIIAALQSQLNPDQIMLDTVVHAIEHIEDGVIVQMTGPHAESSITCRHVLFALPPRLLVNSIELTPEWPSARRQQLSGMTTWMAGQAKLMAFYRRPFWREAGLSGDVISQRGPLSEIHDASSADGSLAALFGFVSLPARERQGQRESLIRLALAQLARLFGDQAGDALTVQWMDWATEAHTATSRDGVVQTHHSSHDLTHFTEPGWGQRLLLSGSETADCRQRHNGYLEGALEASERTLGLLNRWWESS